jgi:4-amino-4-deoxy-L-arabinose transferase-like glycosyltransferase
MSGCLRANEPDSADNGGVGDGDPDRGDQPEGQHPNRPAASCTKAWWRSPLALVIVAVVAMLGLNLWWYGAYRRGFPLHIDESGYTAFALAQFQALQRSGLSGLLHSVETQQTVFGPLVPFLTVPLEVVAGQRIGNGYLVILAFYVLLVLATYDLARRIVSPGLAALAAVVVATAPEVLTFARAYYFAVPAAALLAAAVACFLRSEGLTRTPWALAGGLMLGLALLSRTQMLAAVPCVLAAAFVPAVIITDRDRARRLANLAGAAVVATGVAATWYGRNFGDAVGYLRGTRFRTGTPTPDAYHLAPLLRFVGQIVDTTQLPVAVILLGVAALAVAQGWRRTVSGGATPRHERRAWLRRPDDADRCFLLLVVAALIVVFATSELISGAYPIGVWLLVLPILVPLAMVGLASLSGRLRRSLAALLAVLAVFNVVMVSGFAPGLAEVRTVGAGSLGPLVVTDGRQFVQQLWAHFPAGPPGKLPDSFRRLPSLQHSLTAWLLRYAAGQGQQPVVFVAGGESRFLNINDLALADRLLERHGLLITGRVDVPAAASLGRYCPWLDDPRLGLPNFVTIHRDTKLASVRPGRPSPAEARVEAFGFRIIRVVELPDGPTRIYWRSQGSVPKRCPH